MFKDGVLLNTIFGVLFPIRWNIEGWKRRIRMEGVAYFVFEFKGEDQTYTGL